jgi:hypothetical protein
MCGCTGNGISARALPPYERSADSTSAPNANGNSFKSTAHMPVVGLLDSLTALNLPAISPARHVVRRRFAVEQQQHAAGGFLNATPASSRTGEAWVKLRLVDILRLRALVPIP